MSVSSTTERVTRLIIEHLGIDPEKVTPEASFRDDLSADSLETVELVMALEDQFGIEIPDDAAHDIHTVGDAIAFIEKSRRA